MQKGPKPKLDKVFDCPFCNFTKTVEVDFKRREGIANISCRVCAAAWRTGIGSLSEPIDVYSDWIDECERNNPQD